MSFYCKNCLVVFEGERCPVCSAKGKVSPAPDDPVFLVEKEVLWSPVLGDVLEKEGIPFYRRNVNGAAMSLKVGPMSERVRFYVHFGDVERAKDIANGLFSDEG